jgi:uncharacterized protein
VRIAAVADLHYRTTEVNLLKKLLSKIRKEADILVLAGDLTDNGRPAEAEGLVRELKDIKIPIVGVLGNHDHESDQADELVEIFSAAGIHMLNGTAFELDGVGFVGTKGFCGGFDNLLVQPFGERALKTFIQTSIEEAVSLENALAKLQCPKKVVILHYSPIKETLLGEPPELYPFLGSSRLGNAVDRQSVRVIFHGHAHHGSPTGKTPGSIPVHNVCRFVQDRFHANPYCVVEL